MKSEGNSDRWKTQPGDLIIETPDGKTITLGEKPKDTKDFLPGKTTRDKSANGSLTKRR